MKLRVVHAPGMRGTFSKPSRFSDPDIHHGMCRDGEGVPGIHGACETRNSTYLVIGQWDLLSLITFLHVVILLLSISGKMIMYYNFVVDIIPTGRVLDEKNWHCKHY